MVEAIVGFAGRVLAAPGALYVDVGAGTGISTAALLRDMPRTAAAIDVEPGDDMRSQAQAASAAGKFDARQVYFVDGITPRLPIPTERTPLLSAGTGLPRHDRTAFSPT